MKLRWTFLLCCIALVCAAAPVFAQITRVIDDSETLPPPSDPPEPTCLIDIRPGICPNVLDLANRGTTDDAITADDGIDVFAPGATSQVSGPASNVVFVAILGTPTLKVSDIDISSIRLEGVSPKGFSVKDVATAVDGKSGECECSAIGRDRAMDLVLKFAKPDLIKTLGNVLGGEEIPLTLTATLNNGTPIEGGDCVLIANASASGQPPLSAHVRQVAGEAPAAFRIGSDQAAEYEIDVFNVVGQRVWSAVGTLQAGETTVNWDGRSKSGSRVASGTYFYRVVSGDRLASGSFGMVK